MLKWRRTRSSYFTEICHFSISVIRRLWIWRWGAKVIPLLDSTYSIPHMCLVKLSRYLHRLLRYVLCACQGSRSCTRVQQQQSLIIMSSAPCHHHHHHHHPRISSRRKSWNKASGPLCVTYYTTAVMSMVQWPIVCIAAWSAEQFRFQCTLECPHRRQRRDRRRQRIPNHCRGNGEGAIADGPVQRPWNMQRRWRCRSQMPICDSISATRCSSLPR